MIREQICDWNGRMEDNDRLMYMVVEHWQGTNVNALNVIKTDLADSYESRN